MSHEQENETIATLRRLYRTQTAVNRNLRRLIQEEKNRADELFNAWNAAIKQLSHYDD